MQPNVDPQRLQRDAYGLTTNRLLINTEVHGDLDLQRRMQAFHPKSFAVTADIGNGPQQVGVQQLQQYQREQKKRQQEDGVDNEDEDNDDDVPSFARPPAGLPEYGSGIRARSVGEINKSFNTNSNKRKAPAVTNQHHRERRNGLGSFNPMSAEGKEEEDDEIQMLGNYSNALWSPPVQSPLHIMVAMGFAPAEAQHALAMFGGNVNRAANFCSGNIQGQQHQNMAPLPFATAVAPRPFAAAAAAAPPVTAAVTASAAEPIDPNEKEKANKINARSNKIRRAAMKNAKDSPRDKALYLTMSKKEPLVEDLLRDGIEEQLLTQEHHDSMKMFMEDK